MRHIKLNLASATNIGKTYEIFIKDTKRRISKGIDI